MRFVILLIVFFSTNSYAGVKELSCKVNTAKGTIIRKFIVDTNDFSKDFPRHETTLVSTYHDPNEVWFETPPQISNETSCLLRY